MTVDVDAGERAEDQPGYVAQLQATLNVIPAHTWYASPSGGLTFVNKRTADYLGLAKDHPLRLGIDVGAKWDAHLPFVHPDDRAETQENWSTRLRTGEGGEGSFRVRNAEGAYRWFLSRAEPLRASDGTILQWVGVNLDIEERKCAEEALVRSEAYLAETQKLTHTGTWAWDARSQKVLFCSEEMFRIYGLDPQVDLPTRRNFRQRVHPEDRNRVDERQARVVNEKVGSFDEFRIVLPDGTVKHVSSTWHTFLDGNGELIELMGTATDITERKRGEQALRESEYKLRQIIDTVPSLLWSATDLEFEPTHMNRRLLDYFGRPFEDFQRGGWEAFIHPDDLPETAKALSIAAQSGTHCCTVSADGKFRWHVASLCAIDRETSSSGTACLLTSMKPRRPRTGYAAAKPIWRKHRG